MADWFVSMRPDASDNNDGKSIGESFSTIARAMEIAQDGDRIRIESGTYPEHIKHNGGNDKSRDLTLEALDTDVYWIGGAKFDASQWQQVTGSVWRIQWPYNFTPSVNGWDWQKYPAAYLTPLQLRREVLVESGQVLTPVLFDNPDQYPEKPRQYSINTESGWLYLNWGTDNPLHASIFYAVQPNLLTALNMEQFTIEGINFMLGSGDLVTQLLQIERIGDVTLKGCTIAHASNTGIALDNLQNLTLDNVQLYQNGLAGYLIRRCENVTLRRCQSMQEAWKNIGGDHSWSAGVGKISKSGVNGGSILLEDCYFYHSNGSGAWIDYGNENVTLRRVLVREQKYAGIYLEANIGPHLVEDCVIEDCNQSELNYEGGLLLSAVHDTTVKGTRIQDCGNAQIRVSSRGNTVVDGQTLTWERTRIDDCNIIGRAPWLSCPDEARPHISVRNVLRTISGPEDFTTMDKLNQ